VRTNKILQKDACDNKGKQTMVMEKGGRERGESNLQFLRNTDDDVDFE
jgi:hypothetical protein